MSEGKGSNEVHLRVAAGPLVAPVLSRVVAMIAARANCPVDRLDDAMLLADAIAAHAPQHTVNGHVAVVVSAREDCIELNVTPLVSGGADGLVADSTLPDVGSVLERVADQLESARTPEGDDSLLVRLSF